MTHPLALPDPTGLSDGPDLLVRRPCPDDIDDIVAQCQDPEFQRWTTVPVAYRESYAVQYLSMVARGWQTGTSAAFAIEHDGRYAGSIDLRITGTAADVGYGLAPWARGKGVMTRALRVVLAWGFDELKLDVVHWRAAVGNWASRRVATRCGFQVEGTVRGLVALRGDRYDGWIGSVCQGDPLTG